MSVTRRWRVVIAPRTTNESVYSVSRTCWTVPPSASNIATGYAGLVGTVGPPRSDGPRRDRPGAGRDEELRAVLQPLVQRGHRRDRVDVVDGLVGSQGMDAREA